MSAVGRKGGLMLFCGAGISMLAPSRSPSWWEIYAAAASALADRFNESFPHLEGKLRVEELLKPLQTQQLADLIFVRFAGATFAENLKVVDVADANENHMLVVAMAATGCLRGIVTTNFDTLIERTASVRDVALAITTPNITPDSTRAAGVPLIKIHGSTVDAWNLVETSSDKAREISADLPMAWTPLIRGTDLLVIGYSGADLNFGAAASFFDAFAQAGGQIFWLHRPGERPAIPLRFEERTTFLEGSLPQFLRELAVSAGAEPFVTPVTGRDAQLALKGAMDKWSRELHIGKWAAALFFYALASEVTGPDSSLVNALAEEAKKASLRLRPGEPFEVMEGGIAGFLDAVGLRFLSRLDFEGARACLRTAVNIYETLDHILSGEESRNSEAERHMNLSSSWSNYALALVMSGEVQAGLRAFSTSLQHSYLGGDVDAFLITLYNILSHTSEYWDTRRILRLSGAGIRIADRAGAVQASVELRLLLASYHLKRNEVWTAAKELKEARRRADARRDQLHSRIVAILEGYVLLKCARIEEGLSKIATAVEGRSTAFFLRPVEDVRRYLNAIGVSQKTACVIELSLGEVPELARRIEKDVADARSTGTLPWDGRHCSVAEDNAFSDQYRRALFNLGIYEFDQKTDEAISLGLGLAGWLLGQGYFQDAVWITENVIANPAVSSQQSGHGHLLLAQGYAKLAVFDRAAAHLNKAAESPQDGHVDILAETADFGLWHSIQCGEIEAATFWAERLAHAFGQGASGLDRFVETMARIDSWGSAMTNVGQAFRTAAGTMGIKLPPSAVSSKPRFEIPGELSTDLREKTIIEVGTVLEEAARALGADECEKVLSLIDQLPGRFENIPDHQASVAISLRIQALRDRSSAEELDRSMDSRRKELCANLAFSSLARLETAIAWNYLFHGNIAAAAATLKRNGFVSDLADDIFARISLKALESRIPWLLGGKHPPNKQDYFAAIAVRYYTLPESRLFDPTEPDESAVAGVPDTVLGANKLFFQSLKSSQNSNEIDAALMRAIRLQRRAGILSRASLGRMRGDRANWALRRERFQEAARLFEKTERTLRRAGDTEGALNAMAGLARSHSRDGDYLRAVEIFDRALSEANERAMRRNLLLGLAAAHLLEASRRPAEGKALRSLAVSNLRNCIKGAPLESKERALAKLGLARALGELGEQDAALAEFDEAIAELAHRGVPEAKSLIENRGDFEAGYWDRIGLS